MAKISDVQIPSLLFDEQGAAPSTPASGFWRAYFKSDGLYVVDDTGTEVGPLSVGGGGDTSGVFEGATPYCLPGASLTGVPNAGSGTPTNTIRYCPLFWSEPIRVVNLVVEITGGTSAGRAVRVGLWEAGWDLQPGDLVAEGEVAATSTGIKTVAVNEVLPAGRYLAGFLINHASIEVRFKRVQPPSIGVTLGTNDPVSTLSASQTYGPMPDPGPAWTLATGTNPLAAPVFLEVTAP